MVKVSIIIPVYNESKYIVATLNAIKEQDFKDIEVILADNGSTDGTREIARRTYPKVKIVVDRNLGFVGRLSNSGSKIAKGDLFLFIDGDTTITKGLLDSYYKHFQTHKEAVAATGPIVPLEKTGIGIKLGFKLVSVGLIRFFMLIGKPSIISSNFMVKASAYRKVRGFDPSMKTYYDWDISKRLVKYGKLEFVKGAVARTSIRRVKKWGMLKYFAYHASNVIIYNLFHKSRDDYEVIR